MWQLIVPYSAEHISFWCWEDCPRGIWCSNWYVVSKGETSPRWSVLQCGFKNPNPYLSFSPISDRWLVASRNNSLSSALHSKVIGNAGGCKRSIWITTYHRSAFHIWVTSAREWLNEPSYPPQPFLLANRGVKSTHKSEMPCLSLPVGVYPDSQIGVLWRSFGATSAPHSFMIRKARKRKSGAKLTSSRRCSFALAIAHKHV